MPSSRRSAGRAVDGGAARAAAATSRAPNRYLIKALGSLRSSIRTAEASVQDAYRVLVASMSEVYDVHKLVCARFGGTTEPSLRMNASAGLSAVEALDRLKQGRLRAIGW